MLKGGDYMKYNNYLKQYWPVWVAAGSLGLCQFAGWVESMSKKASQEDARNNLHLAYDMEKLTNPWCVQALLAGRDEVSGKIPWQAGEVAKLGDQEFYNLGYGKTNLKPTEIFVRGERFSVADYYRGRTAGMYSFDPGEDAIKITRTCRNVRVEIEYK